MKPQEQEFPHDPSNGVYGDCFRATLASILEMPISTVPHFLYDGNTDYWHKRLNEFLNPLGYIFMCIPAWDLSEWRQANMITCDIYHEISDISPRFPDTLHSVVGCNGLVVHDPHPSKLGLPEVTDQRSFGFLVKV